MIDNIIKNLKRLYIKKKAGCHFNDCLLSIYIFGIIIFGIARFSYVLFFAIPLIFWLLCKDKQWKNDFFDKADIWLSKNHREKFFIFLIFITVVYLGIDFQRNVYLRGYVGYDSGIGDDVMRNIITEGKMVVQPTLLFIPNDTDRNLLPYNQIGERKTWYLSGHFSPSMYLFAPFRYIFQMPEGQLYAIVIWVAISIFFIYFTLANIFGKFASLITTTIMMLSPIGSGILTNVLHPVILAIPFLLASIYFLITDRYKSFFISEIISLGFQETIPIFALSFSIYMWKKRKILSILNILLVIIYFIFADYMMRFFVNIDNTQTQFLYGGNTYSIKLMLAYLVNSPLTFIQGFLQPERVKFLIESPIISLIVLSLSMETMSIFFLSIYPQLYISPFLNIIRGNVTFEYIWHYSALILPATLFAFAIWFKNRQFNKTVWVITIIIIFLISTSQYGQWYPSKYWFSNDEIKKSIKMPAELFNLAVGQVAVTYRPMIGLVYNHNIFPLDRMAVPHSPWPKIDTILMPTDIGYSDEWSNHIEDAYLYRRAVAEYKNFGYVSQQRGYQLWINKSYSRNNESRLYRFLPAESLLSNAELRYDSAGYYRIISDNSNDLVMSYGFYRLLLPARENRIKPLIDISILEHNFLTKPLLNIEFIKDGNILYRKQLSAEQIEKGEDLKFMLRDIIEPSNYEILINQNVDIPKEQIKLYGIQLTSSDDFLENPLTFFLRVKNGINEIPSYIIEGDYEILYLPGKIEGVGHNNTDSYVDIDDSILHITRGNKVALINVQLDNKQDYELLILKIRNIT